MKPVIDRFIEKVHHEPNTGCWLWESTTQPSGHGKFWMYGHVDMAHRASWRLHRGPIPTGMSVLHKCDVPACVNPDHLFIGTQADNLRDMSMKGRGRGNSLVKGSGNPKAKLTEAMVKEIRKLVASGVRAQALPQRYNVSWQTVRRALNGYSWRHVMDDDLCGFVVREER